MKMLRGEEEWVRRMIHAALRLPVEQHDDGSQPSMYDLYIARTDGTRAAVEVTAAADGESIALWNLMNGRDDRWQVPQLHGRWLVRVHPTARATRLRRELPEFLALLERFGIRHLDREWRRRGVSEHELVAQRLGVTSAHRGRDGLPGTIHVTIDQPLERTGGCVPGSGDPLARWVSAFLAAPRRADVRDKLARSGAAERHAFVIVPGFTPAPFAVADLLLRDGAPLPTHAPSLPPEVTHVWIASTWISGDGFRWSPSDNWTRFGKQLERRRRATA